MHSADDTALPLPQALPPPLPRRGSCAGSFTATLTVFYTLCLLALVWSTTSIGERNGSLAFLLYLPPVIWFLPAPLLSVLGLAFHRKSLLLMLVTLGLVTWYWLGYQWPGLNWEDRGNHPDALTILTYNQGQNGGHSLQPFTELTQPDLLVLQDAPAYGAEYLKRPEFSKFSAAQSLGEYTLLSSYPILEAGLVPFEEGRLPRAARFVVNWKGSPISVYAVHLQSPRGVLRSYSLKSFMLGWASSLTTSERAKSIQRIWEDQLLDLQSLLAAVRKDPNPSLIVGDFNAPHVGHIYRMLAAEWKDAHAVAGKGMGLTFPGKADNPLSLDGPWLRLDYIFSNAHWEPQACITESEGPSQHRAVAARLRLLSR